MSKLPSIPTQINDLRLEVAALWQRFNETRRLLDLNQDDLHVQGRTLAKLALAICGQDDGRPSRHAEKSAPEIRGKCRVHSFGRKKALEGGN